jgi:2-dehydro-3-deoxygalactonokinase
MTAPAGLDWIAADWGTSNLRVWAMSATDAVLARAESDEGMGRLDRAGFEPALIRLIGGWLPQGDGRVPVLACGMVGSRQGWVEAAYRAVPCAPSEAGAMAVPEVRDGRIAVRIVPGLKQAKPADVMRGEETQIAGFLAGEPDFDGVLCLPGTHCKWVHVSAGEVVGFQTFLTGEVFALLAGQSVLRHSVGTEGWDDAAFAEAVGEALSRPERVMTRLFGLRAEALLAGLEPGVARARLSGLLIGAELAGARAYWLGRAVAIIGSDKVGRAYAAALAEQGVTARRLPVEAMTLAGLGAARAALREGVA